MKNNNNMEKASFVLKIIALSLAVLAFVVLITATMTKWIIEMRYRAKLSRDKFYRNMMRRNKHRKNRIHHILKQRKIGKKEEKKLKKEQKNNSDMPDESESEELPDDFEYDDFIDDLNNLLVDEDM